MAAARRTDSERVSSGDRTLAMFDEGQRELRLRAEGQPSGS